jgi:hypothetical protein
MGWCMGWWWWLASAERRATHLQEDRGGCGCQLCVRGSVRVSRGIHTAHVRGAPRAPGRVQGSAARGAPSPLLPRGAPIRPFVPRSVVPQQTHRRIAGCCHPSIRASEGGAHSARCVCMCVCGTQGADPNFMNAAGDLTLFWCVMPPSPVCRLHPKTLIRAPTVPVHCCTRRRRRPRRDDSTLLVWETVQQLGPSARGFRPVLQTLNQPTDGRGMGLDVERCMATRPPRTTPRCGSHSPTLDASIAS